MAAPEPLKGAYKSLLARSLFIKAFLCTYINRPLIWALKGRCQNIQMRGRHVWSPWSTAGCTSCQSLEVLSRVQPYRLFNVVFTFDWSRLLFLCFVFVERQPAQTPRKSSGITSTRWIWRRSAATPSTASCSSRACLWPRGWGSSPLRSVAKQTNRAWIDRGLTYTFFFHLMLLIHFWKRTLILDVSFTRWGIITDIVPNLWRWTVWEQIWCHTLEWLFLLCPSLTLPRPSCLCHEISAVVQGVRGCYYSPQERWGDKDERGEDACHPTNVHVPNALVAPRRDAIRDLITFACIFQVHICVYVFPGEGAVSGSDGETANSPPTPDYRGEGRGGLWEDEEGAGEGGGATKDTGIAAEHSARQPAAGLHRL